MHKIFVVNNVTNRDTSCKFDCVFQWTQAITACIWKFEKSVLCQNVHAWAYIQSVGMWKLTLPFIS